MGSVLAGILAGLVLLPLGGANAPRELSADSTLSVGFSGRDADVVFSFGAGGKLSDEIQLVSSFSLVHMSREGNALNGYSFVAGPEYNFLASEAGRLVDAAFVGVLAGVGEPLNAEGSSVARFSFSLYAGKRFRLSERISYRPRVSYARTNGAEGTLAIVPLGFSVFL